MARFLALLIAIVFIFPPSPAVESRASGVKAKLDALPAITGVVPRLLAGGPTLLGDVSPASGRDWVERDESCAQFAAPATGQSHFVGKPFHLRI